MFAWLRCGPAGPGRGTNASSGVRGAGAGEEVRLTAFAQFLWAHDDTGVAAQQVRTGCRPGTNSYRVQMKIIGLSG
jgi:hypothetical protein